MESFIYSARSPSLSQSNHKTQVIWKGRGDILVQHFPSCVKTTAVDAASSRSGAAVAVGLMNASEGGIRATDNYVAGGN
jgi:hypothetical protein